MAFFSGLALQDGGSDLLRTRAATANRIQYHVLRAYTANDNAATVLTNSLGSVAMVAADFVQSGASGGTRTTTVAAKNVTLSAGSGAAPNVHVCIFDSVTNEVLLVNDETNNTVMVAGGLFQGPAFPYQVPQPVAAA